MLKKWKKSTKFINHKIEKSERKKENSGIEVYVCAL
jgi:hypothetical protein